MTLVLNSQIWWLFDAVQPENGKDHMPIKAFRINAAIWDEKGKVGKWFPLKIDRILREYRGKITQYFHDILLTYTKNMQAFPMFKITNSFLWLKFLFVRHVASNYGINGFHLGESTKGNIFVFQGSFYFRSERKRKCKVKGPFYVMSADISNFLFMTSQKDIVSKVLFSCKKKLPNNYRFSHYKVCGFWKMQEQQNIPHLAAILVGHKVFILL